MKLCSSCNKEVNFDFTEFPCPKCGNAKIIRCDHCKSTSKEYKCIECSFVGP
ncbi:MAG: zinc finger domain-containing protein [archaeon]